MPAATRADCDRGTWENQSRLQRPGLSGRLAAPDEFRRWAAPLESILEQLPLASADNYRLAALANHDVTSSAQRWREGSLSPLCGHRVLQTDQCARIGVVAVVARISSRRDSRIVLRLCAERIVLVAASRSDRHIATSRREPDEAYRPVRPRRRCTARRNGATMNQKPLARKRRSAQSAYKRRRRY